jgi:predicted 2-oxoglutarate/Fe(II)-dependent dioxygenase YbiX
MNISRPAFATPVICIDEFLDESDAQRILTECVELKRVYAPAKIFDGPAASKVDVTFRSNEVVYLDDVFRTAPERSDILTILRKKIWTDECKVAWHEGDYIFDVINYSTWQEAVVSRYGDGGFYKRHQDTRRDHITYRLVTLIYYVNAVPEHFSGGELVIWKDKESLRIQPKHNRAIIFPSFSLHEVGLVRLSSQEWEHGRFSVNYWMGFR